MTLEVTVDDAELVARAITGDRWAHEALYRRHAPAAFRLASHLVRRRADAEDVVQDAFVTALGKLASLRDPAAFAGWLARIVANAARARLRGRWWRDLVGGGAHGDDLLLASMASPSASAADRAELTMLDRALSTLRDDERLAWSLRYIEGWELTEVAELCRCSLATAKRRIAAARDKLAVHVTIEGDEP